MDARSTPEASFPSAGNLANVCSGLRVTKMSAEMNPGMQSGKTPPPWSVLRHKYFLNS